MDEIELAGVVAVDAMKIAVNHDKVVEIVTRITPHSVRGGISPMQALALLTSNLLCIIVSAESTDGCVFSQLGGGMESGALTQTTINNLNTRWKQMPIQATGRNISNGVALGSLILIMLWTAKILFTPVGRREPIRLNSLMTTQLGQQYDLEFIYKLGYDDGKSREAFRSSLPLGRLQSILPLKTRPNLRMGTVLSMFALCRFGKELITYQDGRVIRDPNLIWIKLKSLEPWRLGLIFMSLYHVLGALCSFLR
ncbi:hypothetical protein ACHAW6_010257 [Cyclotella cf. meneghiniana]